ncbi:hypothetical protein GOP47_0006500 [Adiantum capillus-veneris]|uniref:3-hydroxyisobutyryl-CoA hydrolase n=1 Tax=Adiantum capillus-veneris TaxID=13818 RepID=A0A9D4V3E3_ADICA|nr:hypothetical protein GOP47_0006500 [Adiantum capillus-veneris]
MASRMRRMRLSALHCRLLCRSSTSLPSHREIFSYTFSPSQRFFSAGRSWKPVTEKQVVISRGLGSRVATINNPKRANALTTAMARKLRTFYERWESEVGANLVILQGAGGVFSSGADVKELYRLGLQGNFEACREFFRELYNLNYVLGTYRRLQVSVLDGLAVGGACALTSFSHFQLASENAAFSSPETRIGFHPDAGSSFLLSCLKGSFGEYLALTGEKLDMTDMIMTRLVQNPIQSKRIPEILHQLHSLDTTDEEVVTNIIEAFEDGIEVDPDSFLHREEIINRIFSLEKVEDIIYALEAEAEGRDYAWYRDVLDNIRAASPLSQKIALKSIRMARQETLAESLQREYRISCRAISGNLSKDFYEGVRAHLIDKDHNPKWSPGYLESVSDDMVDAYFQPFENEAEELELPLNKREGISNAADSDVSLHGAPQSAGEGQTEDVEILNWAMNVDAGTKKT